MDVTPLMPVTRPPEAIGVVVTLSIIEANDLLIILSEWMEENISIIEENISTADMVPRTAAPLYRSIIKALSGGR